MDIKRRNFTKLVLLKNVPKCNIMKKVKPNYKWNILHKFEDEYRRKFLSRLNTKESIGIFMDMFQFAQSFSVRRELKKINIRRAKLLGRVHSMFNKVK